jgi:hypothetical protein
MLFAKCDDMSPEIPEWRLGSLQTVEHARQLAVESLLGNVPTCIEWIERVGETIIKLGQTRNLVCGSLP